MKNIKVKNGYYLNDFSSVSEEHTWGSLTNFIKKNIDKFSSVNINENEKQVIVSFYNKDNFLDIIKYDENIDFLKRTLIRTIKLNTKFNKETKTIVLTDENTEKFKDYNEVIYSINCRSTNDDSSIFFHESALVNYTENESLNKLKNCSIVLALVTFDQHENIFNIKTDKMVSRTISKSIFLALDFKNDKLVENSFEEINVDVKLKIDDFIKNYNEDNEFNKSNYIFIENNEENIITYSFSNFKIGVSEFLLPSNDLSDFINFKNFSGSFIYTSFINSLYNSVEKIWPLEDN